MLAPEAFPDLRPDIVIRAMMAFLLTDADRDKELSEEELKNTPTSNAKRLEFADFPVSFDAFVEAYQEIPRSRFSP